MCQWLRGPCRVSPEPSLTWFAAAVAWMSSWLRGHQGRLREGDEGEDGEVRTRECPEDVPCLRVRPYMAQASRIWPSCCRSRVVSRRSSWGKKGTVTLCP